MYSPPGRGGKNATTTVTRSPSSAPLKPEGKHVDLVRRLSRSRSRSRKGAAVATRRLSESKPHSQIQSLPTPNKSAQGMSDVPPLELPPMHRTDSDHLSMIGVAVGSPSQLCHPHLTPPRQSARQEMAADLAGAPTRQSDDVTNKKKGARWQKIGALFKAKNAFLSDALPTTKAGQSANPPGPGLQLPSRHPPQRDEDGKGLFDKILGANGRLGPPGQQQEAGLTHLSPKAATSLLDVSIPNVQMERYSVMFGNLLDKQEPPSLLARRGKPPNRLNPTSEGDPEHRHAESAPKGQSPAFTATSVDAAKAGLKPESHRAYPRRATSPNASSKSPSFSLFPPIHQPAEKQNGGPVPSHPQSPRRRSFTAPGRLSPMEETDDSDHKAVVSPPETTCTSASRADSSNHSLKSSPSTSTSVHRDSLLDLQWVDSLITGKDRAEVTAEHKIAVAPLKPPPVQNGEKGTTETTPSVTKGHVDLHEDTLAALERPGTRIFHSNEGSSSLKPSRAHVDQIMGGALIPRSRSRAGEAAEKVSGDKYAATSAVLPGDKADYKQSEAKEMVAAVTATPGREKPVDTAETSRPVRANVPSSTRPPIATQRSLPITQASTAIVRPHPPRYDSAVGRAPTRAPPQPPGIDSTRHHNIPHGKGPQRGAQRDRPRDDSAADACAPRSGPPAPGSNRSFPRHMPPQHRGAHSPLPPAQRQRTPALAPPTDNTRENILDYYLHSDNPTPAAGRRNKKLPQQLTDHSRPNNTPSAPVPNRDLRTPQPPAKKPVLKLPQDLPNASPPIPISKYSPIATTSAAGGFSPRPVPSSMGSTQPQSSSTSRVKPHRDHRPNHTAAPSSRRDASSTRDSSVGTGTFYSHINASSPDLLRTFKPVTAASRSTSTAPPPSKPTLRPPPPITRSSSAPIIDTISTHPTTATVTTAKPTPLIRLHPSRGEKIVECHAVGLVPRIVVPETTCDDHRGRSAVTVVADESGDVIVARRGNGGGLARAHTHAHGHGHRTERSVNLVIESV